MTEDGSRPYQTLPWNSLQGWHAGVLRTIHISTEICEDLMTDTSYFNAVYRETVDLCVYLQALWPYGERHHRLSLGGRAAMGIASNHADADALVSKHGKAWTHSGAAVKAALVEQRMRNDTGNI